jgi:hypothetical protein
MKSKSALSRLLDLFEEDAPDEPFYDPVHVGGVLIGTMAAIGALYWLLWTLLVFEGGIFQKIHAGAAVLFTSKTLKDFGYEGSPYAMGAFEGWVGNVVALALTAALIAALHRLHETARLRRGK